MELINAINEWAAAIGMRQVFGDQYYFDFMRDKNGAVSPEAQRLRDQLAENWAVAIGLQKVDGLTPSRYLIDVAKRHIEGDISGAAATRMIDKYYETKAGHDVPEDISDEEKAALGKGGKATSKKRSGKSGQKTVDRILVMLRQYPESTQQSLGQELGINRSAIQRHLSNLKSAGKLRRVGPDKGGHWEVIG